MNKQVYVVNTTDAHLLLRQGYVRIDRDGWKRVFENELEHPDFIDAMNRGMIKITDTEPVGRPARSTLMSVDAAPTYRGMTSDELRAEQAKNKPAEPTCTPLGRTLDVVEPAVAVEAVEPAEAAEVPGAVVDGTTEATPARKGRKPAAEKPVGSWS